MNNTLINRINIKTLPLYLFCVAVVSIHTHASKNINDNYPKCKETDFKCRYCDEYELDCSSRELLDGMLTSPTFSLSTFVPQRTSIINLSRNELTFLSVDYSDMWVDGLNQLVLCHNNIEVIYAETFRNLLSLVDLDLSYNKLSFLQSDVFIQLKSLQTLDLSHNMLPRIDGFWFQGPRQLIRLNLSYNKIGIFKYKELTIQMNLFNKSEIPIY